MAEFRGSPGNDTLTGGVGNDLLEGFGRESTCSAGRSVRLAKVFLRTLPLSRQLSRSR